MRPLKQVIGLIPNQSGLLVSASKVSTKSGLHPDKGVLLQVNESLVLRHNLVVLSVGFSWSSPEDKVDRAPIDRSLSVRSTHYLLALDGPSALLKIATIH